MPQPKAIVIGLTLFALTDLDIDAINDGLGVQRVGAREDLTTIGEAVIVGVKVVRVSAVDLQLIGVARD